MKLFIIKASVVAILILAVMLSYHYLTTAEQHEISSYYTEDGQMYEVDGVQYTEEQFRAKDFKRTIVE